MREGIFIPAGVVRLAVGALAAVTITAVLKEAPGVWRYYKMKTM